MRRSGNVCDVLVFCLVAVLLPAWLLGHLFLMFFPASDSGVASQPNSDPAGAVAALADEGSSDKNLSNKNVLTEGSSDKKSSNEKSSVHTIDLLPSEPSKVTPAADEFGQQKVEWEQKISMFETSISDLKTENRNLTMKTTELENLKSAQVREIAQLKNRLEQMPNDSGDDELAAVSTQLQDMRSNYAQLDKKFRLIQTEKSQLQTEVSKLTEHKQMVERIQSEGLGKTETDTLVATNKRLLSEANEEKDRLQSEVNQLTTTLKSTRSSFAIQKQELVDSNSRLEQLNARYAMKLKELTAKSPAADGSANNNGTGERSSRSERSRPAQRGESGKEQYREYVSSRGNRSRLAFIQWIDNDQVVVRSFANKQLYQVPIERFSAADQEYLKSQKKSNGQ